MAAFVKKYIYEVDMTCGGCSGAVSKVLGRERDQGNGIVDFEIDLEAKKVLVIANLEPERILEIIQKTGKKTLYIGEDHANSPISGQGEH